MSTAPETVLVSRARARTNRIHESRAPSLTNQIHRRDAEFGELEHLLIKNSLLCVLRASAVRYPNSQSHQTIARGLIKSTGEKLGRLNHLKTELLSSKSRAIQSPTPARVMIKWTSPLSV